MGVQPSVDPMNIKLGHPLGYYRVHEWAFHGPPPPSSLRWPKRRIPLDHNMKSWRNTIRRIFFSASGIYPNHLGAVIEQPMEAVLIRYAPRFHDIVEQYEACYRIMLGNVYYVMRQ